MSVAKKICASVPQDLDVGDLYCHVVPDRSGGKPRIEFCTFLFRRYRVQNLLEVCHVNSEGQKKIRLYLADKNLVKKDWRWSKYEIWEAWQILEENILNVRLPILI